MKPYSFITPSWLFWIMPNAIWRINTQEKKLYLTFDDGPTPGVTDFVLNELDRHQAKATFFCLGYKLKQHKTLFQAILEKGHTVGNHSYTHPNGWKTKKELYLRDVEKFDEIYPVKLFRPPYGKLKRAQRIGLKNKSVIMWSHMSGDFDQNLDIGKSRQALLTAKQGSILLFHDSEKAFANLKRLLPEVLSYFSGKGYTFEKIEEDEVN